MRDPWEQLLQWFQVHETVLQVLGLLSVLFFVGTLIAVPLIIIILPAQYLVEDNSRHLRRGPAWFIPYLMFKNVFGALFILAGLAMLVLPGQGLLTLVIGFALIDFPGKKRVFRRVIGQRGVLSTINRLRAKANKPPLEVPQD